MKVIVHTTAMTDTTCVVIPILSHLFSFGSKEQYIPSRKVGIHTWINDKLILAFLIFLIILWQGYSANAFLCSPYPHTHGFVLYMIFFNTHPVNHTIKIWIVSFSHFPTLVESTWMLSTRVPNTHHHNKGIKE